MFARANRWTLSTVTVILLLAGLCAVQAPAQAAPGAPTGLRVVANEGSVPTLTWERTPGATKYEVQVSAVEDFSSTVWTTQTVNLRAVPTTQLPNGTVSWRVRAFEGSTPGAWSNATLEQAPPNGPDLVSPLDGRRLSQPDEPTVLTWQALAGATSYEIQVSTDREFVDPALIDSATSGTTSYILPAPQLATTYYWRVRGVIRSGITTTWSTTFSYLVRPLGGAELIAPHADGQQFPVVTDAVLDWSPVPGARTYDLQISVDDNFLTVDHAVNDVTGTRYARPQTLRDDQYYWRVRPVDVNGNRPAWDSLDDAGQRVIPIWKFQRKWTEQPNLTYPADDAEVGDPLFFQWTAARHASRYTLQLSTDSTFPDSRITQSCTTTHVTFAPGVGSGCWPTAAGTYHWRVLANDGFPTTGGPDTDAISAEVRTFVYAPERATLIAPADGDSVAVPTLSWHPQPGASTYRVTITSSSGSTTSATTAATSYTPRGRLAPGDYRWQVQTISEDDRVGAGTLIGSQRSFTVTELPEATALTPEPGTSVVPPSQRFPTLTWSPVVGANRYQIQIRPNGSSGGFTRVNAGSSGFYYPAGEDTGTTFLAPGEYEWRVEAFNGSTFVATSTHGSVFTIEETGTVTGQRAALTGTELSLPDKTCAATLPSECQDLPQTPVLAWDAVPNAGYYRLFVSRNETLTNLVDGFPVRVNNTMWISPTALPDAQAGSAYYWFVQPCSTNNVCAPLRHANRAFNKRSNPVILQSIESSSGSAGLHADDVTFTWRDYLGTNLESRPTASPVGSVTQLEAGAYRIQVSTDPNFVTGMLDNIVVDQTSFTSYANTYPEGPLHWRVQAIDGSGNSLVWSDSQEFTKRSPVPEPLAPVDGVTTSGNVTLQWRAARFAAGYDVEVYRNGDTQANLANRVLNKTTKQISFAPTTPLPVSNADYVWRVRRVDAKSRKGDWSDWKSFRVTGQPPTLLDTDERSAQTSYFRWEMPGTAEPAANFLFELLRAGSSAPTTRVITAAHAYAPTSTIEDGEWQWRVSTLDTDGKVMATSQASTFTVDGAVRATNSLVIQGSGEVGTTLSSLPISWHDDQVSVAFQWYRGTSAIQGATEPSYVVTPEDRGKAITLRATGSLPGHRSTTVTSNAVVAVDGTAPVNVVPPTVSGSGRVNTVLTSTDPQWDVEQVTNTYQWLRDGEPIRRATTSTYIVGVDDVGKNLRLQVTGVRAGHGPGTSFSNEIRGLVGEKAIATARPAVTGTLRVGQTLRASSGNWSPSGNSFSYQWLRNGKAISNARSQSYRVTSTDAYKLISVRVTASRTGFESATATSNGRRIAKMSSNSSLRLSSTRVRASQRAKAYLTVSVSGLSGPSGKLQVKDGYKVIKTITMYSSKRGRVTYTLPKLKRGKHRISFKYLGSSTVSASTAKSVTLTVSR